MHAILVIDDDENIRETLSMALKSEGFIVDSVSNGKDAITKSFENFYEAAIVDWRLPDMEGTKLLGELKETTPKMVKILLTGFPSIDNAVEALNNRADAFLVKPVDLENLLIKLKELLQKQEKEKTYDEEKIANFIETKVKKIIKREPET